MTKQQLWPNVQQYCVNEVQTEVELGPGCTLVEYQFVPLGGALSLWT